MANRDLELKVEPRTELGSAAMRRLRSEGILPGVVYTGGEQARPVTLNQHDFHMTVRGCRATQIFKLSSEDKELDGEMAFIKDVQIEPIKDQLLHVDFLTVKKGQTVSMTVPVELVGEPAEVKQGLAVLEQRLYGLDVECIPSALPEVFTVDVSDLTMGSAVHVSDVKLPEGVEIRTNVALTVASVTATRAAIQTSTAEAGAEGEGEAGSEEASAEGAESTTEPESN